MSKYLEEQKKKIQEEYIRLQNDMKVIEDKLAKSLLKNKPALIEKLNQHYHGKIFINDDNEDHIYCKLSDFRDAGKGNAQIMWTIDRIELTPYQVSIAKFKNYPVTADVSLLESENICSGVLCTNEEWDKAMEEAKQKLFGGGN